MAAPAATDTATGWLGLDALSRAGPAHLQSPQFSRSASFASTLSDGGLSASMGCCAGDLLPSPARCSSGSGTTTCSDSPVREAPRSLQALGMGDAAGQPSSSAAVAAPVPWHAATSSTSLVQLLARQQADAAVTIAPAPARRQLASALDAATAGSSGSLFGDACGLACSEGGSSCGSSGRVSSQGPLLAAATTLSGNPARGSVLPCNVAAAPAGPPPEILLAALSASLAAKQEQARAAAALSAAGSRPAAHACASCHMLFADLPAYQAHCASQEHAMAVVQQSLLLGTPGSGGATPAHGPSPPPSLLGSLPHRLSSGRLSALDAGACPVADSARLLSQLNLGGRVDAAPAGFAAALPTSLVGDASLPTVGFGGPQLTPCCNQVLDPQLDSLCHALLKQLRQLDGMERALGLHAAAAGMAAAAGQHPPKTVRRLVGGLREVRKAVKHGYAAAVVAAVDIQETNPFARCSAQPGADIAEICQLATLRGVPVVFALTRMGLGSIFGTNKRMSAVALTNVSGVEEPLGRVLQLAALGRARFDALLS